MNQKDGGLVPGLAHHMWKCSWERQRSVIVCSYTIIFYLLVLVFCGFGVLLSEERSTHYRKIQTKTIKQQSREIFIIMLLAKTHVPSECNVVKSWVCVWISFVSVCACESALNTGQGPLGKNEWAHHPKVQRLKPFHSFTLQSHLWKTTRNVLSCLSRSDKRPSRTDICSSCSFL